MPRHSDRPTPLIYTENLLLRAPAAHDVEAITRIVRHRDILRWLLVPRPYEKRHAEDFVRSSTRDRQQREGFHYVITRREDGVVMGALGLNRYSEEHRRAELGYWLGKRYQGKGYMKEAGSALLDQAFGRAGLQRVFAMTIVGNAVSERVLQRLKFTKEGEFRRHVKHAGRYRDLVIWGLLKEDWR